MTNSTREQTLSGGAEWAPTWLAMAADMLACPLMLLRADATLLHANVAARELLARGHDFKLAADHRVRPAQAGWQPGFDAALALAVAGGASWFAPRAGAPLAALRRLASGDGAAAAGVTPVMLALPAAGAADLQAYAERCSLSPAELRVLQHLARGERTTQVAVALGLSPATVRSQVLALRRKTGHPSVASLLREMSSLPPLR